jgi:serine/threonine protein kinase
MRTGTTFAGYRVESLVGRGGMGVVYRATDLSLQRPVALKLIAPEPAEDERFRARFLRESRLAASLDHPNVIPIYEAGERDGQLYLAMRFVEDTDLKSMLDREGTLAPGRALGVLAQVASALDAAHRRALVHRDVKPATVLLDEEGHVLLQAAQAAEVVMKAIARSHGTRASVLRELRATRVRDGILGDFRFDRNGDIKPAKFTVIRVTGEATTGLPRPGWHRGATFDRVIEVPAAMSP